MNALSRCLFDLQMRPPLKKAMFHLAWSPDSLPTSEAIAPLFEYLDVHLVALNSTLLTVNFNRVLQDIWEVVLGELSNQMDGNAGVSEDCSTFIQYVLWSDVVKNKVNLTTINKQTKQKIYIVFDYSFL